VSKERHPIAGAPGFQDKPQGGLGIGFIVVVSLIAFVTGGIVTMAVTGPSKGTPPATQAPVSAALPARTVPTTPTAQNTDPLKQQRPLTDFLSQQEIEALQKNIGTGQTQGSVPLGPTDGSSPSSTIASTANPNIPNPQPWQYDPVANKHYVPTPGHQHWHGGKPPAQTPDGSSPSTAIPSTSNPSIPNPQPWQYDPVTNKHYVPTPGHEHWHNGQPPPPDQRR
jgi:hypothetical protein